MDEHPDREIDAVEETMRIEKEIGEIKLEKRRLTDQVEFRHKLIQWTIALFWLILVVASIVWYIARDQAKERNDRIAARYVLCTEMEALKAAERRSITEKLRERRNFLRLNPDGIPGLITREQILAGISIDQAHLDDLRPYPGGCVAFARDPSANTTRVPPLPE